MENKVKDLIDKAESLIKEDKYPDAIQVFAEAFIIDPYNIEVNERIAFLWNRISEGNYDFEPETAEQFMMRGVARFYKEEFDNAYHDYTKAIRLNPNLDYAYKCRGILFAYKENHQEAHKNYAMATKLNPKRGEYWDDAATSFEAIGDIKQAHLCHEHAVHASPDDARLCYNYGVFFAEYLGDAKEALKKFEKAIEIWPKYEDAIVNRNQLLALLKEKRGDPKPL